MFNTPRTQGGALIREGQIRYYSDITYEEKDHKPEKTPMRAEIIYKANVFAVAGLRDRTQS